MELNRPSFVGVYDILGFSRIVKDSRLETLVKEIRTLFDNRHLSCRSVAFSDTIVLYTEGDEPDKLTQIVEDSALLIGIFADQGRALRGAISVGEFYCDAQVFAGKAMIRAYELEQSQDWLGAIVDPIISHESEGLERYRDVLNVLVDEGLLRRWPAPIKGGTVMPLLSIGWYQCARRDVGRLLEVRNWDAARKIANAVRFQRAGLEHPGRPQGRLADALEAWRSALQMPEHSADQKAPPS